MTSRLELRTQPNVAATPSLLKKLVASNLSVPETRIVRIDVLRRSIDARQRNVMVNLSLRVHLDAEEPVAPPQSPHYSTLPSDAPQAIVVGAGPAGLFAALALIENGVRPIILERGKDVDSRRKDLAKIARNNVVDPDSNYSFGEGGAGAYSDGKLYTRSKKRGNVEKIINILYAHGAPADILVDAHPHIGTNLLPDIIKAIRQTIIRCGGQVHFQTRVSRILIDKSGTKAIGVQTSSGQEYLGPVILATGHSARDIYLSLADSGIEIQPKGIAVGVRLEHPARLIDCLQYHSPNGRGKYLPAAEYSLLTRVDNRAVYSFCMCPGGVVVPAATGPGQIVVNGMSASNRGSKWSNSGMVVEVLPEDIHGDSPLRMMRFQEQIEKNFFDEANGSQNAPAQRMNDFVLGKTSASLPQTSYAPGIHPARIDILLPSSVASRLQRGFLDFNKKQPGFLTNEAILIGCETRTSSPVRIPRDPQLLNHVSVQNLYPAGEGAGYAGGIVSAAIDGERCALALAQNLKDNTPP